jgi:hypothetical protein
MVVTVVLNVFVIGRFYVRKLLMQAKERLIHLPGTNFMQSFHEVVPGKNSTISTHKNNIVRMTQHDYFLVLYV